MERRTHRGTFHRHGLILAGLAVCLLASAAWADDLTGADTFLCTGMQVHECTASGGCESGLPWDYNIPVFVEVDLVRQQLRTTEASGEDRSSPIRNLERDEGYIFLQGVENGRAFSAVIAVEPGLATFTIATDGTSFTVFGACTPVRSEG